MCVHVCVYMYVYECIYVCICVYVYVYVYICVCVCVYMYIYILVYTACIRTDVMELSSTQIRTCIRTEFVGYKVLPQKIHTLTFRRIPVTHITPCCLFILTLFLTTLTAEIITEVMKMGGPSHGLMPPSESTRHKLFPSTIYLH